MSKIEIKNPRAKKEFLSMTKYIRTSFDLSVELHKALKVKSAQKSLKMRDIIHLAIEEYLTKN